MSSKLSHRQLAALPEAVTARVLHRASGAAGIHADQNRKRGAKAARGGRQGERNLLRKNYSSAEA